MDNGEWANHLDNSKIIYLKSPKNGRFGYDHNLAIKRYAKYSDFFLICNPACSGCFMLFCSMALLKLGGFDERHFMYLENFDLSRRCAEKFDNCYVPTVIIYHKHTRGSYKDKQLLKYHIQSAFKYFNKWGWLIDKQCSHLNQKAIMQFSSE